MKISEIEIDDSQTGYYWVQIYVKNKKARFISEHVFNIPKNGENVKSNLRKLGDTTSLDCLVALLA